MAKFSKRMKQLLAVMLVEVIVATNVFVSYADEYNSDEPKVMAQMTESEADELAAEVEAEEAKEEADEAGDEEALAEETGEEGEMETPDVPYGEETPATEGTENAGEAGAEATASVIPAELPTDETGNQEEEACICEEACTIESCNEDCPVCSKAADEETEEDKLAFLLANCKCAEEAEPTATPSETPSATPVKEEVRASVKISAAFEDKEGNALEELAEKELTFEDSMDLTESPFSVTGYEYKEARINGITVTALHVTEETEESDVDQSEAKEDGVQSTVTLIYSYVTADGEEVALTEDTTVTFVYEAEEVISARVTVSAVDSFGDAIAEKYTDMDLDKLFKGGDTLILDDTENPPVSKVQVRKGLFKVVQYQYVKATMDQKILTGLKREEVKSKDAEKKYVYSISTDGESWTEIEEDTTVLLEYTDGQKSVFAYEDDQVLVTATLQHAGAIPEDAQFVVTPVTSASSDYNYDAYMNALNANADRIVADSDRPDGGRKTFTEENTLLYDVAFLAQAVDEEGNVQEDNLIEYQPAEGMVNISFVFKQNQLSDGLDARSEEDLTIVHLPLQEAVKEETATTAAATDISAADVNVEIVADSVSLNGNTDQADFCLSSFSVVAVVGGTINEDPHMTDYSLNNILNNYNYFIFGNTDTIHTVGAVIVEGDAVINAFGGASVGGSAPQKVPSYIKGKASDTFANNRATDVTDLVLYLGTTNYEAFKNAQVGPGYVGTLQNIIFTDDYVDFEAAHASIVAEAGSIKCKVHISEQDIAEMKSTEYYSVTEGWSGKKILHIHSGNTYEIDSVNGLIQLDLIMDNVSDVNDTVVRITDSGEVTFPVTLINGKSCTGEENGPGTSITWHFPSASKVNLPSDIHVGHVIAPDSDVFIAGGTYNGCVIAKNLVSKGEGHMWSYTGKIFTPAASGFKVQKQLLDTEGNAAAWPEGQTFTFILKGLDGAPMPADANGAVKSVVVKSTGIAGFGDITFPCDEDSQAAEYHYELREVKGSQEKISYDETVYHITVKVSYQETSGNKKAVIESVTYTTDDSQDVKTVGESFVYSFTNVYDNIEKIDIPVSKIWVDENNQDGLRPESIRAELYADGQETGNVLILNKGNNWSGRWTDLPKTRNGQEILYTIKEVKTEGYTAAITGDAENGFTITNTHKPEVISIEGSKVWKDADNQDGKRPDSITVNLLADGVKKESREVTEKDNWKFSFTGLPKYADGKEIDYRVTEDTAELQELGYSTLINGTTIINSYTPGKTNVTVVKAWNDAENQDGTRPDAVQVQLYADGSKKGSEVTLNEKNGWTYTWEGLDLKKSGKNITYTVKEITEAEGYTAEVTTADGIITITNTHTPEITSVKGSKVWVDDGNQDGKRPESITIRLYADGKEIDQATVSKDNWSFSFTGLPKYKNVNNEQVEIRYTITEDRVEGYETAITGEGNFVVTNTHRSELTEISGTKTWNDQNDQDGKRPSVITVKLMKNGSEYRKQEVTEKDNWKYTFKDLPVYENGQKITYTVAEVASEDYSSKANGYDLKNSYTPEKTSYSVVKLWDDADNQDGLRPASVKVQLYANGIPEGDEAELNVANGFAYTWTGLDLKSAGKEITYTVKEITDTEGYTVSYQVDQESHKTMITNSHTPAMVDIPVTKTWNDADDQDGKRPGEITVNLLANGKVVRSQKLSAGQADKEGSWTYIFTGLPEKKNGQKIVYTVTEEKVTGYETAVTTQGENGFVITNSHTPETTEVNGVKTWNDKEDKENARPDSITVRVFDGDQEAASKTVTEDDNWTWNFTGLPKYKNGKEISYTVTEDHVPDYTTKVNGFNITNTYTPDETAITVVKVWDDANDQDCKRPDSITVVLHEKWGGIFDRVRERAVLSDENNWSVTFDKLPVNKKSEKVNYWIEELTKVPGYDTVINNPGGEQNQTTITITNSYTPETVRIDGSKKWSDYDNQEGKRPESIQVILYQNGKETDQVLTVTPDDKGNWNYSFTDLPKYRNENGRRVENVYTVKELTKLADYETPAAGEEDNNYVILNRMKQVTVGYSVTKNWIDDNNRDGLRKEIPVQLFADGRPVDGKTAILTEDNGWSYHWSGLPKYNAGDVKIEYTVAETEVPAGYNENPEYAYEEGKTVITNSHTPELVSVSGEKIWKDADDQDGKRPQAIIVVLKADGKNLKETTVTADNGWKWSFEGLYKYENGRKIVYTAEEKTVPAGYTAAITGNADGTFTITNSYTPETTEVSGTKTWKDADDQDGVRPDSIMVYLKNGEKTVASKKVTAAENWQYSFTGLPKYESQGQLISYTVDEKLPEGYEKAVTGADITNSYTPGKTSLTVKKHWSDAEDQDGKRPENIEVQLYADGKPVEGSKAELNEQNGWSHTWTDLDQRRAGQNISYAAKEVKVPDGYEASYNNEVTGTTEITNTHTTEIISLSGSKVWSDADDQDGLRPFEITVNLYGTDKTTPVRTEKVSADTDGNWSYRFTDLPRYENGEEIRYTVAEEGVPEGYESSVSGTGTKEDPFVITNTHTPEVISIAGTKTWVDGDNEEGKRPSEITVNLYKNEEKKPVAGRTVKAAADGTWSYRFEDLPKYENGREISYRVSEGTVKDYSASYNGNDIVNIYTPDQTQITVTKVWEDENDQDGKRPESIEVQLYAGRSKQGETVTLSESNQWTYTWKELPSTNALGFRIHYTVKEVSDRGEYKTTIAGDTNVIITNSYTPEVTFVKVDKQWNDYDDQENKRPESIKVSLLADGEVVDTITLKADDNGTWSHTFENLPKYRNDGKGAQEIQYTVKEAAMADYTSATEKTGENTFVITNTMEPVFTEYEVTKFWDDADNQDGLRKEITVELLADGKEVEGKTITLGTAQGETHRWTGLPKYNEEGTRILYTAREAGVPDGYAENPGYVDTEGRTEITNRRKTEPAPTPGSNDPTPDPTTDVTPEIIPPDEEVLGVKRVTDNAVLGARRGSDLAVLGKRRRPQTGDDMSLILWLVALGASMSCAGVSIAMQYRKSTKKDKK